MKCPFLVKRKEIFDREGKRLGEELEIKDCIKNECMVYDGAAKLCSFLSTNIKNGILIEDIKKGVKELKEEMFQRSEAIGVIVSTTIQTMQEALLNRFDILKKQNEVFALGFDRLGEVQNSLIEIIKNANSEIIAHLGNLIASTNSHYGTLKSQEEILGHILQGESRFTEEMKAAINNLGEILNQLSQGISGKFDILKSDLEKLITTYQVGIETISGGIEKSVITTQEVLKRFETFDNNFSYLAGKIDELKTSFSDVLNSYKLELQPIREKLQELISMVNLQVEGMKTSFVEGLNALRESSGNLLNTLEATNGKFGSIETLLKGEIASLKDETNTILGKLLASLDRSGEFLSKIRSGIDKSIDSINSANRGYLEAIGKLAELSENVQKKWEKTGEETRIKFDEFIQAVRSEVDLIKGEVALPVNNIQSGITKFEEYFDKTLTNIANMSEMMNNLNRNYLESLSKIAGLAEGMRRGVEGVGEGMQSAVGDLISEMKNEIGALREQYQRSFDDLAKLAERFEQLNSRIGSMTNEIQNQFKETLNKQVELATVSGDILKQIKDYFEKEEIRYNEEQVYKRKKEGQDHFDRATLYYYRGSYELALAEIDKALEIEKLAEYLNLKGLVLVELGREMEAKEVYEEALKLEPNLAEIYNNLGLLHVKTKKLNEAVTSFQEAIKRNVNYSLAYVHLGKVLTELERFDEAISAYEHALRIDPANRAAKEALELFKEGKLGSSSD